MTVSTVNIFWKLYFSGQRFALLELKMFCVKILHSFQLEAIEKHKDFSRSPDLILRPEKDIHVTFTPINL